MIDVTIGVTPDGTHYKVVKRNPDGQPVLTPFFEKTDNGNGMKLARAWCKKHGYHPR